MPDRSPRQRTTPRTALAASRVSQGAVLLLLATMLGAADWTPPKNPDPDKILTEAQDDTRAGRYADALAKHVWFYENALTYAPAMYGVRLSFALSYWVGLADVYPPALTKLQSVRDAAATRVREERNPRSAFHDFASINRELKEQQRTTDLFLWLNSNRPDVAKQVFGIAEPALVEAKQYELCGKYLDPDESFERMVNAYRENKRMAHDPGSGMADSSGMLDRFADQSFSNGVSTLVGLLVLNGRTADADRIAAEALRESTDPELKAMVGRALKGELPPRWP
jgi:hypothetical protein